LIGIAAAHSAWMIRALSTGLSLIQNKMRSKTSKSDRNNFPLFAGALLSVHVNSIRGRIAASIPFVFIFATILAGTGLLRLKLTSMHDISIRGLMT
jgi:hypothetical protein